MTNMSQKEYEFWLGGVYEDLGTFSNKKDAERGINPDETLSDLLDEFKDKKVRLKIEVIED